MVFGDAKTCGRPRYYSVREGHHKALKTQKMQRSPPVDVAAPPPRYEFLCEKCKKPFEVRMTTSEREKAKPKCPTCKGTRVVPQFGGFMAQTSKKS
jgi:putative FmdB family regulatory protein